MSDVGVHATEELNDLPYLKELAEFGNWLSETARSTDEGDSQSLIEQATRRLMRIASMRESLEAFVPMSEVLKDVARRRESGETGGAHFKQLFGLSTSIPELDAVTGGLRRGELTILAGVPTLGRTRFLMRFAHGVALKQWQPVAYFSLGTGANFLGSLLLDSLRPKQDGSAEPSDGKDAAARARKLADSFEGIPFHIDFTPALSSLDIRIRARHLLNQYGKSGLVVVGSIALMAQVNEDPWQLAANMRALKQLAQEQDSHVMVTVDLSDPLVTGRLPCMEDLRRVGPICHEASLLLMFAEDCSTERCQLTVSQNEYGPTGLLELGDLYSEC